jgi:hypothetical protein
MTIVYHMGYSLQGYGSLILANDEAEPRANDVPPSSQGLSCHGAS